MILWEKGCTNVISVVILLPIFPTEYIWILLKYEMSWRTFLRFQTKSKDDVMIPNIRNGEIKYG